MLPKIGNMIASLGLAPIGRTVTLSMWSKFTVSMFKLYKIVYQLIHYKELMTEWNVIWGFNIIIGQPTTN